MPESMTDSSPAETVSDDMVERFARDGAVCLRAVIDQTQVDALSQAVDVALSTPGPYQITQSSGDDPGQFSTEYYASRRVPGISSFVRNSPLAQIASRLLDSKEIRFFFDGLFVKAPRTQKPSHWHQDQPYYPVDGQQLLVIWTPLDTVDAAQSLQIIKGSHRWGRWFVPVLFRNDATFANDDGRFAPLPDIDAAPKDYDIMSWSVRPGDCIAFHALCLHGASGNPTMQRRRALSSTWLGDDTVYAKRSGTLEPHFAGLDFPQNSRLTDPDEFPLLWPR